MMRIAAALIGLSIATAATAQGQNCGNHDLAVERLTEKYGESRQSIGIGTKGRVVETCANLESGTWTVLITAPNGITCIVASGQAFERLDEVVKGQGI